MKKNKKPKRNKNNDNKIKDLPDQTHSWHDEAHEHVYRMNSWTDSQIE